jgi:hypothetical protein
MHSLTADLASGILDRQLTPHLSLFQPTHRRHPENQQDRIRFRNLVSRLGDSLSSGYSEHVETLLEPFHELGREDQFWNKTLDGIAVLGAPGFFRVYQLARRVPERAIVADSFHLKPLLRIRQSADAYHVLALNRREMRLYEGSRDHLSELDLVPGARTITEALGEELTEPHLTVASYGSPGDGLPQRHGHGSKQDEIDLDTEKYFRAVDRVVLEHYSSASELALILAALPEYQTPFRRLSHNRFLLQDGIPGDPGALSGDALRERAWAVMEPGYLNRLAQLVETFGSARAGGRGAADPTDIAKAAIAGRVDTLLIEAERVIPGRVDASGAVAFDVSLDDADVDDVLDDIGELVLKMKGHVVVVPAQRMPTDTGVAAVYRF